MKSIFWLTFIYLLFYSPLSWSQQSVGTETTIIADADEMIKDSRTRTLQLKGNVNVIFQQQHLLCDEAVVYEDTSTIIARGNVVLQNPKSTLRGEKIEFNYDTNKGKLYNGVITSGQVLLEAEIIEKIGEDDYVADDAYFTACTTCPASWGFTSTNIEAEIGGYAYISRPWLHLLQFPVLPLPYLVVPLNSKRQTGFLVPKPFSSNGGGFAIEFPFFWAIDRSHDATFSLINYEKRGQQGLVNYRYVISPTSSGELNTSYIRDRSINSSSEKNRWFIDYLHHYDLPNNYTQRAKIAMASDRLMSFDFLNQFRYQGEAALENSVSLSKQFEGSTLTLETSLYQSQIERDFNFQTNEGLHRLPEINYNMVDQKLFEDHNVFFSMDMQYLNIARMSGLAYEHTRAGTACDLTDADSGANIPSDICYPTAISNGNFVYGTPADQAAASNVAYGDLIRTGQRIDIMPSLHAPFWVGDVLDISPSFGVRYTQYSLGVESDDTQGYDAYPSRFYTQFGLNTRAPVSRIFDWSEETKIRHSIIPYFDVRYIPNIHQSRHNFFGTPRSLRYVRETQPIDDSDADFRNLGRGIQFDNNDRVIGKQIAKLGLINKVISRPNSVAQNYNSLSSRYTQNFVFNVYQVYDIQDAQRGADARPWQSLNTDSILNVGPFSNTVQTSYFPYHGRTQWNVGSAYSFLGGNQVGVQYAKTYVIEETPPVNEDTRNEQVIFSTGLSFPYVYLLGSMAYNLNAKEDQGEDPFTYWSISTVITPPGSCWLIRANIEKVTDQRDRYVFGVNMEFTFGT